MLFNSFQFLIFFTVIFFLYWLLPHKFRWILLLVGSYYFYMCWRPEYALLLLSTTMASYGAGFLIDKHRKFAKFFMWGNIVFCLGLLVYFKYFNFFCQTVVQIFAGISFLPNINIPIWDIVLPVGISFMIFQNIGYTTDVYRGEIPVEKHWGYYALFASFFPQLVAGPIERTKNLLPQLKKEHIFTYETAVNGMRLILFGLFKKVAVADTIAIFVDNVYNNLDSFSGFSLLLATFLFTIQIYCDFSGYSDIARGCANMLGINLMLNFDSPYFSKSVSEFWRRWHISLSTWFRDNVYIPLGGNREGLLKQLRNLIITFVLSGIWHGAGWTFITWGLLHGLYQCLEKLGRQLGLAIKKKNTYVLVLKNMWVFILICFAWIFFRANNMSDAVYVVQHIISGWSLNILYFKVELVNIGFTKLSCVLLVILLSVLFVIDYINYKKNICIVIAEQKMLVRWSIYIGLSLIIIFCIMFTSQSQNFIYFQF